MDSGNSGSMQSSSGGDEEYESRADTFTAAFMNHHPSSHINIGPIPTNFHPQSSSSSSSPAIMFDPVSNFFDPRSSLPLSNTNPLLNLDMVWSRNVRSDNTQSDLTALAHNQNLTGQLTNLSAVQNIFPTQSEINSRRDPALGLDQNNDNGSGSGNTSVVRNSKKRPRASRRAPTTVLTTDTTNFRAMVQEFTGIPAPPFTASSPFPRNTRFDLFSSAAIRSSATHLSHSPSPSQPYLLRPFPQKPSFLSPPPPNFQQNQPVFNIQNMFQSSNKQQGSSNLEAPQNDQTLKMGNMLEEFGLAHSHGLQPPPADETLSLTRDNNSNPPPPPAPLARWVGGGAESELGLNNYSNGKPRYSNAAASAHSSEFLVDKAAENVTARSEGMVESWICSSD